MPYPLKSIALVGLLFLPRLTNQASDEQAAPIAVTFGAEQLQGEVSINQLTVAENCQIIAGGVRVGFNEDGRWGFLEQSRTTGIRCLFVDGDTLWVGSPNEIGRLTRPLNKQSHYQKIDLPMLLANAGDIWDLARRGSTLIATTKEDVWFIEPERKSAHRVSLRNNNRLWLHSFGDQLVVTALGIQPRTVDAAGLRPFEIPLPETNNIQWLGVIPPYIVTGAIYKYEERTCRKITKFTSKADPFLYTSAVKWGDLVAITANNEQVTFGEQLTDIRHTTGLKSPFLTTTGDGSVWLLGEQDGYWRLGQLRLDGHAVTWETVETKGLSHLPGVQHLSANGDILTICGGPKILELKVAELKPSYRLNPPRLKFTYQEEPSGEIRTREAAPIELSAKLNTLTFQGDLPFDEFGEPPCFERRLLPTQNTWTRTAISETVAYPSLSPQNYTIEVRTTHLGRTGPVTRYTFTVRPPWYFSALAFGSYTVCGALLSFIVYQLRTQQIRRRNRELEEIVAARTRELAEASAAQSEFVVSMSYQIRNPMNGVIGLVNLLRDQPVLPRQTNHLRLLHTCAEQLRATVDDMLDFSKILARHVAIETADFDLWETLEAAVATVDPAGTTISFTDRPPDGIKLRGDAPKLRQIFTNFLSNALKYGVPPGARVSTILTPVGDRRVKLMLSVGSYGPTIEKDALDKIFESFARGNDAINRNILGTGLGLAICKHYATAMGGEVGAESTNGETTFYLNVPLEQITNPPASSVNTTIAVSHPTRPARALAIEDDDYNRIVLGGILAKMNYTVDWATNGAEAVKLAQENDYDIILTDYRLPDTNGVELTKKILQLCSAPKPAVFAVTAYSTRERRDECLEAGMAGFISKPITLEKLRTTIANWGERQLTKIPLETFTRKTGTHHRSEEISRGWVELKRVAAIDCRKAAHLAHELNNLCRSKNEFDLAEQLELLEGALVREEPSSQLIGAIERFLSIRFLSI